MSDLRQAAQAALGVMELLNENSFIAADYEDQLALALNDLRAALAEPKAEPVAWLKSWGDKRLRVDLRPECERWLEIVNPEITPLYLHPPAQRKPERRKPLTDEQILAALCTVDGRTARLPPGFKAFARAVERAHGIE